MPNPYYLITRDAQLALTDFSDAFRAVLALGEIKSWSTRLGMVNPSNAVKTTWPLPISAAGYVEFKGDPRFRTLFERSLSMTAKEWQDGVEAPLVQIDAPDFIGWADQPSAMALEAQRQPNKRVALDVLEANPYLDLYRQEFPGGSVASTIRLFADAHPVNIFDASFGTFDNDKTATAINSAFASDIKQHFRSMKGPNGESLGLHLTDLLVPSTLEEQATDFFERDMIIEAVTNVAGTENVGGIPRNNRHKGTVTVEVADELTDANYVYGIADGGRIPGWIVQASGNPEEVRFDRDSEYCKLHRKIAISEVIRCAAVGALPHGIVRYRIG